MKFKNKKIFALSVFAALALQSGLYAQSEDESTEKKSLGNVEVLATDSQEESYTVDSMNTSTKLDLSLRNTPQSVSVLTAQKLEDMGVTSYQQMLRYVTGVTIDQWDERMHSTARGFTIDYYKIDGMPTYSEYNERDIDLAIFERVEIVRGANGLTTGSGNPSMSINLVRKRANSKEFTGDVSISAGSWNSYGLTADIGSKLNESGSVRGRLVVKHESSDSYMDKYEKENNVIYGVVDADLTDTTYLSIGGSYQKLDRSGIRWGGLPAFYSDGTRTDFDRSQTVSEDWTYWNSEIKSVFADLKQNLYKDITFNASYSHDIIGSDTALLYFNGAINKADGSGIQYMDWLAETENVQDNYDVNIDVPFELGGLTQQLILGASYNLNKTTQYDGIYPDGYYTALTNYFNYNIAYPSSTASDILYITAPEQIEQKGVYLAGKFSLTNDLKLIAGARLSSWEYTSSNPSTESRKFDNEVTPYVGLVYDLDDNHSIYASYTSIFQPQSSKDSSGNYLNPIEGKSYETGIKGEYFDGKLNTSLSIFRIEQDKVAKDDPSGVFVPGTTTIASVEADGVTSKGFEFDVSGKVTDNFTLDFGIANFEAKEADGAKYNTKASRTTANIFGKYTFNKFAIGAGVNYKSKYYTDTTLGRITQDAFALVNAMASYKIDKSASLQLNVDNLFDKKYYDGIGANGMVYGTPRSAMLTLKYTF
ncbi:TonB-dependent siderophore receptor [Halarcobacter ebronensis]|uniref:TonB-dependent siderophore receptor n=1 Tax=Halarcobacter ebronensis TaxID=1462615 RepID=A0A4Q0YJ44_9BACT|nr:TonB-dependent siderophore receptor [Halarcobacter ebronensis]RXJ68911.1 TonB-dependent siderophore receptor [Halarcobacter ebronensis]